MPLASVIVLTVASSSAGWSDQGSWWISTRYARALPSSV